MEEVEDEDQMYGWIIVQRRWCLEDIGLLGVDLESYQIYVGWKVRGCVKYMMDGFQGEAERGKKDGVGQFWYGVLKLMGVVLSICLLGVMDCDGCVENVWVVY